MNSNDARLPASTIATIAALATIVASFLAFWLFNPVSAAFTFTVLVTFAVSIDRRKRGVRLDAIAHRLGLLHEAAPADLGIVMTRHAESFCEDDDPLPPYIERPEDSEIRHRLKSHRIAILEGAAHAGKTRSALQAVGRQSRAKALLLRPFAAGGSLAALLAEPSLVRRWSRVIVFVDELDKHLGQVDRQALVAWLRRHPRAIIVASINQARFRELSSSAHPHHDSAHKVLTEDWLVRIPSQLSDEALREAEARYGERPETAKLGAMLGGSTQVVHNYEAAYRANPTAFGLVTAAIEATQAGITRAIRQSDLIEFAKRLELIGAELSAKEIEEALDFCCAETDGVIGMLLVAESTADGEPLLLANSVLPEAQIGRDGQRHRKRVLPDSTWEVLAEIFGQDPSARNALGNEALASLPDAEDEEWLRQFGIQLLSSEEAADDPNQARAKSSQERAKDALVSEPSAQERAVEGPSPAAREPSPQELREASRRWGKPRPGKPLFDPSLPPSWAPPPFYRRPARRNTIRFAVLLFGDLFGLAAGTALATWLYHDFLGESISAESMLNGAGVAVPLIVVLFAYLRLYRPHARRAQLIEIEKALAIAALGLSTLALSEGFAVTTLLLIGLALAFSCLGVFAFRLAYDWVSRRWVEKRGFSARTLIAAPPARARQAAGILRQISRRPMQFVGFIAEEPSADEAQLGVYDDIQSIVASYYVERIIFADPDLGPAGRSEAAAWCHLQRIAVEILPTLDEVLQEGGAALTDVSVPLIELPPPYLSRFNAWVKRIADLVLGALFLSAALMPLTVLFCFLWALGGRKSPVLASARLGRRRSFSMYRLRVPTASYPGAAASVNTFLQRLRIDEVLQLVNVLRGEMSLVGPRPMTVTQFAELSIQGRLRYAMKPGLTGLWQVSNWDPSLTAAISEGDVRLVDLMATLDLVYCRRWSPMLDLTIFLRTPFAVLMPPAPRCPRHGHLKRGSPDVSVGHVTVTRPGRDGHNPPRLSIASAISA